MAIAKKLYPRSYFDFLARRQREGLDPKTLRLRLMQAMALPAWFANVPSNGGTHSMAWAIRAKAVFDP